MSAKTHFLNLYGNPSGQPEVLLLYTGMLNQTKIEHLVDATIAVARLLDLSEATCNRLVSVLIEQCQNITEHAADFRLDPPPYERPGTVIVAHDAQGVYIETCWEVARSAVAPLKQNYDHLRELTDAQLETEYRQVLMSRVKVPGERSVGLYNVARNAKIGTDGMRQIAVETYGAVMDSKIYVN